MIQTMKLSDILLGFVRFFKKKNLILRRVLTAVQVVAQLFGFIVQLHAAVLQYICHLTKVLLLYILQYMNQLSTN